MPSTHDNPRAGNSTTDSFDRYIAIYKLACHWEIEAAKEYAKAGIDSLTSAEKVHAVEMLQFSRQHHVDDWFASSFRDLVGRHITTFTAQDSEKIGLKTLLVIAKTRDALDQHRLHVARFPPPIKHSDDCPEDKPDLSVDDSRYYWREPIVKNHVIIGPANLGRNMHYYWGGPMFD